LKRDDGTAIREKVRIAGVFKLEDHVDGCRPLDPGRDEPRCFAGGSGQLDLAEEGD